MTETPGIYRQKTWRRSLIYSIKWHEKAIKDLQKIDSQKQKKVVDRIKNYLSKDPLGLGKPLKGIFKGLYRYRYGSYRIVYAIDRNALIILILRIADRKGVYKDPTRK